MNKPKLDLITKEEIEEGLLLFSGDSVTVEPPRKKVVRRGKRMMEVEEPAYVKFSTDFKSELKHLNEFALKVFIYIGLSIGFETGKAFPGVRKIAEETGMDKDTVTKAVEELEEKGYLDVFRREGNSNIYTPTRYFSIGTTVPSGRTVDEQVSLEDAELSLQNDKLSLNGRVNLHNQINKNQQESAENSFLENAGIEWKILAGAKIEEKDLQGEIIRKSALDAFEVDMRFGQLPWGNTKPWEKLAKFVVQEYEKDPKIFLRYKVWQQGEGKYHALSNKKIRERPEDFIACFPDFLAHAGLKNKMTVSQEDRTDLDSTGAPISY